MPFFELNCRAPTVPGENCMKVARRKLPRNAGLGLLRYPLPRARDAPTHDILEVALSQHLPPNDLNRDLEEVITLK